MFIRTANEILSVMPTSRWSRPEDLLPYLEEEERGALEPLLGGTLYQWLCTEYERLREEYVDITATTVKPTGKAKEDPQRPHVSVTERLENINAGMPVSPCPCQPTEEKEVPTADLQTIRLIRICQRIEFYRMLSHKAGLLSVSFNAGGGMNRVSADGYDPADDKEVERAMKDAFMSAGRAVDDLLLYLEADAKGDRLFTEKWSEADAFYLHKDLLFQTARVLNEYLDIKGERMAYVSLVRDIRFCQNTYLKPRVGARLLSAVILYANEGAAKISQPTGQEEEGAAETEQHTEQAEALGELLSLLRTALAFYVESRRTTITKTSLLSGASTRSSAAVYQKDDKLARRDSMTDAQQAMAMACDYIEENLEALGEAATDSPIYKKVKAAEQQAQQEAQSREQAQRRRCCQQREQTSRKLFTGFPATHRGPELK